MGWKRGEGVDGAGEEDAHRGRVHRSKPRGWAPTCSPDVEETVVVVIVVVADGKLIEELRMGGVADVGCAHAVRADWTCGDTLREEEEGRKDDE